MSTTRTTALVVAIVCAVVLAALTLFVAAVDLESRLRRRRRQLSLRRDIRLFEKGHQL